VFNLVIGGLNILATNPVNTPSDAMLKAALRMVRKGG
jgi:hypothetical protein